MGVYRYVVADVFTDTPLTGNQLAVFTDGRGIDDETMQLLAKETNFSETVFVFPSETAHARIRIFTPTAELPFAGHPMLGSAFVLGQPLQLTEILLECRAGVIPVRLEREGARVTFGWMSQPIPTWGSFEHEADVLQALGAGGSLLPVEVYDAGTPHVFVTFAGEDELARLSPEHAVIEKLGAGVNCVAGSGIRWKSRMFGAAFGIPEDPASGSAAGPLAVHLIRHGKLAFGEELEITQGVEMGRPSKLYARIEGEGARIDKVEVGGSAVVVARGEFRLP